LLKADEAAGDAEERFVDVVAAFPADPWPAVLVQPGDGALDDPALFAQPGAVRPLGRGDLRRDVTSAQLAVVDLGPRSASSRLGRRLGRTRRPRIGGIASTRAIISVMSLRLATVTDAASGMPLASQIR
jgi:hypothetical protein